MIKSLNEICVRSDALLVQEIVKAMHFSVAFVFQCVERFVWDLFTYHVCFVTYP